MKLSRALDDVRKERSRQIRKEGWSVNHDDMHEPGGMAIAAASYAKMAFHPLKMKIANPPILWPWGSMWWKPKSPRRDLVRAAALIVAEIEKIDRRAKRGNDN